MKPLFSEEEFKLAKYNEKLPFECYYCNKTFLVIKTQIRHEIKYNRGRLKYCSKICGFNNLKTSIKVKCLNCSKEFSKKQAEIKKTSNNFCCKSCAASYNNKHKTTGNKRSKLEIYLENQLTLLYPELEIHYNRKDTINSELDIYIPSLNIAFELNGIFHYEPIFGVDKLEQIQSNDISKSKACIEAKIDLCIIDTSGQKYVKESTSKKYLDIITNIVNKRLHQKQ